jgi:HAD superfamily hydrolase (TIGR01509 family)
MFGKRNDEILRDFFGDALSGDEVLAHGAAKEALYREMMLPQFERRLIPGVRKLLAGTNGTRRGLATNAEAANVRFVLENARMEECFQAVVDGQQVARPKPAPDVYLEVARRLGVAPANCIIFEDSPGGLAAARAAGGRVVCVESTLKNPPGVALAIADFDDPRLPPWLRAQQPVVPE